MTRLIDADALKAKVEAMVIHKFNESDYEYGGNQAFDYVADILIDDAPTIDAVEVVRCKDCICRSDALEQMAQAECGLHYDDCEADNCSCSYIQRILDIPSADRPHGEWIERLAYNPDLDVDVPYIECDQCGHRPYFGGSYRPKYCEECGAKMDGNTDNPHGFTADEWYRNTFKGGDSE